MGSGDPRRSGHRRRALLAALLLAAASTARAEETRLEGNVEPVIYSVRVNGRPAGEAAFLRVDGQRLLVSADDWKHWHLAIPGTHYLHQGQTYFALDAAPGFAMTVDATSGEARLEFAPRAFTPSTLRARPDRLVEPQLPPGLGGFLNYEFVGTRRVPDAGNAMANLNGLVETGLFNRLGVFTGQWLGRNLTDEAEPADGGSPERRILRLETAVTRDFPDDMTTLRLGDGIGAAGLWGRPVRYGGARFTRNFATQPGFVTLPQVALAGETALPSVLDVYVDGLRRQSLEVPPGPFVVENLPTLTGQGEVQIVVRDLLGREVLLSGPYIAGVQQLRAGLHDYSYEIGAVRERFGLLSDEYGDVFAAGTHRYGFDDRFTGEARVEAGTDAQTLGVGGILAIPSVAVISNAFAVSHGERGYGAMDVLSIQHTARRGLSAGASLQIAGRNFTQIGLLPGASLPKHSFSANAGHVVRPLGRFGLAYVNRDDVAPVPDFEAVTATFTRGFRGVNASLLGIRRLQPSAEYSVGLMLGATFGSRESGSTGYRYRDGDAGTASAQAYARLQRNLPDQEGWGYRVMVSESDSEPGGSVTTGEAGVGLNATHGSLALEGATVEGTETWRATASGGLGALGGHAFASRRLSRSFAVVESGAPDVALLVNNRVAGTTDANGVAVLPYLQPYQANTVRIDASNVPLDVEVNSAEFQAIPYYRSGVLIPLDVRRSRTAVVTLLQSDGIPVPPGATVTLGAAGVTAPVGKKGQVFLGRLESGDNVLDVRWNGTACRIVFRLPADAGVQPKLGPYTCPQ